MTPLPFSALVVGINEICTPLSARKQMPVVQSHVTNFFKIGTPSYFWLSASTFLWVIFFAVTSSKICQSDFPNSHSIGFDLLVCVCVCVCVNIYVYV